MITTKSWESAAKPRPTRSSRPTANWPGNIIRIADASLARLSSSGPADNLPSDYTYDAVYRLIEATGPEHAGAGLAPLDETLEVRDCDVVLVPYGYHGPCAAAPGYPLYYLNVLAGSGDVRSMDFCDDPAHAWIRESWSAQEPDPRALA